MPKMKTNRSAAKRFRTSGSGKIMRRKSGLRHQLHNKGTRQKRALGQPTEVFEGDKARIQRLIPYL